MYFNTTKIKRRKSNIIYVGKIPIGGNSIITVQSMTNTNTDDIYSTLKQIKNLEKVGADIIRIAVPTLNAAESFKKIKKKTNIPLIADIHFDYRIALKVLEYGADCVRINPGNIGNKNRIKQVIDSAKYKNIPIRIGINSGSLEKKILKKYKKPISQALVESAMKNIDFFDKMNFDQFKVSIKSSDIALTVESYQLISKKIDQPLHIGITESGNMRSGSVKSAIGIGLLLSQGIGDTLRVSLSADPIEEIKVGFDILKSLKIRSRGVNFISCPTCSRQEFDVIKTVNELEKRLEDIITPINVSIIGCIVNGPGEALVANIGVTGIRKKSILYEDGIRLNMHLNNHEIIDKLEIFIRDKVSKLIKNKSYND